MSTNVLNVMTVVSANAFLYQHMPRFLAYLKSFNPNARLHVVLCVDSDSLVSRGELDHMLAYLNTHAAQVKLVRHDNVYPNDPLLYYDKLRTVLLQIFDIPEGLYIDPDVDVTTDLSGIQDVRPDTYVMWTPTQGIIPTVANDVRTAGIGDNAITPMAECGFLYLRKDADLITMFEDIERRCGDKFRSFGMLGTAYWNVIIKQLGLGAFELSADWHRSLWAMPESVALSKCIHYTGRWKVIQPYVTYTGQRGIARTIVIHGTKERYGIFEVEPYAG